MSESGSEDLILALATSVLASIAYGEEFVTWRGAEDHHSDQDHGFPPRQALTGGDERPPWYLHGVPALNWFPVPLRMSSTA